MKYTYAAVLVSLAISSIFAESIAQATGAKCPLIRVSRTMLDVARATQLLRCEKGCGHISRYMQEVKNVEIEMLGLIRITKREKRHIW